MRLYTIQLSRQAVEQLDKLNDFSATSILKACQKMLIHTDLKLLGKTAYLIRAVNYRIIYEIWIEFLP